jgi:hypothetical protein
MKRGDKFLDEAGFKFEVVKVEKGGTSIINHEIDGLRQVNSWLITHHVEQGQIKEAK